MDRSLLEGNPHAVLEGMIIGAYAIGAHEGYIYVRNEYPLAVKNLRHRPRAGARAWACSARTSSAPASPSTSSISRGGGAFVCGESTRADGLARGQGAASRAPSTSTPSESGLWDKPTNLNNVETWANVPLIIEQRRRLVRRHRHRGQQGHQDLLAGRQGEQHRPGRGADGHHAARDHLRHRRRHPGRQDVQGGADRRPVRRLHPGSACSTCRSTSTSSAEAGSMMGSGGMIVMDEDTCMVDVARYFLRLPRRGVLRQVHALPRGRSRRCSRSSTGITRGQGRRRRTSTLLEELGRGGRWTARSARSAARAPNPVLTTLRYFRDEYEAHIKDKRCPAGVVQGADHLSHRRREVHRLHAVREACPRGLRSPARRSSRTRIDRSICIKCGVCKDVCKFDAVLVQYDGGLLGRQDYLDAQRERYRVKKGSPLLATARTNERPDSHTLHRAAASSRRLQAVPGGDREGGGASGSLPPATTRPRKAWRS